MSRLPTEHLSSRDLKELRMSRRRFCTVTGGVAAAAFVGPQCASIASQSKGLPPGRYFDVHTHIRLSSAADETSSVKAHLAWMDANDVSQAVVLPAVSPEASSSLLTSEFVLAETKPYRDRLIPFCCIDPRTSYTGGHKGLVAILQRWIDQGAKGFGEHKPGVRIDDRKNMALYAACGELKLPVLFHLDALRNMDSPGLPGLEAALKGYPQTTFIGHGPGWWVSISGDVKPDDLGKYPTGPVAPGGAIDRLIEKYPNLYGDLSANSGLGAITRDPAFGREFLIRRADRLMFGTDFFSPTQQIGQFELYRKIDLPADVQAKIFRDNARRLLKIAPSV
jgi:predicted TIM-barrel fold metal-dependent hydrolase